MILSCIFYFSFHWTPLFICLSHTQRHTHLSSSRIRLNSSGASGNSLIVLQRSFDWWAAFTSQTFLLGTTILQVCVSLETKDHVVNMRWRFLFPWRGRFEWSGKTNDWDCNCYLRASFPHGHLTASFPHALSVSLTVLG